MNESEKYIKTSIAFKNKGFGLPTNRPKQYDSLQRQYMGDRTRSFANARAYLATDYVNADCQGLILQDFYAWVNTNIRLADITSYTPSSTKKQDDYKEVLFPDLPIDYFPIGAKIQTMGNTWICINPSNMSSVNASALIARCNASYNSFDYYGNVVTEPIVVEKYSMLGNDTEGNRNIELMDGYFNVTAQLNSVTANLGENKRIILGNKPYHITGFTDFIQEFSGDRDSVHILNFTVRIGEPTENDDMENFIADGKSYQCSVAIHGQSTLTAGQQTTLTPAFLINDNEVQPTGQYPLSWTFTTSDSTVAEVDENGVVTTYSAGSVQITATLDQNPTLQAVIELQVSETLSDDYVAFTGLIPEYIMQYTTETISAAFYQNGLEVNEPLVWSFSGAGKSRYNATVSADGKSVAIECISPSKRKLTITASYGENTVSVEIPLVGY